MIVSSSSSIQLVEIIEFRKLIHLLKADFIPLCRQSLAQEILDFNNIVKKSNIKNKKQKDR